MKIMHRSVLWSLLLVTLALLASGCSKELGADREALPAEGSAIGTSVRFVISTPSEDPVVFNNTRAIQTKNEQVIQQLDIYQFAGAAGEEVLEEVYLEQKFTPVKDGISMILKVKGTGDKKFIFIANNSGEGKVSGLVSPAKGTRLSAFQASVTDALASGTQLATPLLMVGATKVITVEDGMPAQTLELQRIMARLDIKNYEPLLTIKRVRLEQVPDRSYLMHVGAPTDPQTVAGTQLITLPEVNLPTQPTVAGEDPAVALEVVPDNVVDGVVQERWHQHYKHVFYPYVSDPVTDKAKAPVLIIEGTLFEGDPNRETNVVHHKVLQLDGADDYLGFQRNHRYTVTINDGGIGGEADIQLVVSEWNLVTVPIEKVEPIAPVVGHPIHYALAFFGTNYIPGVSYKSSAQIYNEATIIGDRLGSKVEFKVDANTDWDVTIDGSSVLELNQTNKVNSWLSISYFDSSSIPPFVDYFGINHPYHIIPYRITFYFTEPNTTGTDRSVNIYLRSKVKPSLQSEFTIIQSGSDLL